MTKRLRLTLKSLVLPDPDDWFRSVFGDQRGPEYAAASAPSRSGVETAVPSTLADLLKEKKTLIVAHRFEGSCDNSATAKEYPLLLQRESPVPLYDARFQDSATEVIWQYFAYVDGGFRYIGNLAAYPPALAKKQSAPQGAQSTAEARGKKDSSRRQRSSREAHSSGSASSTGKRRRMRASRGR